MTMRYCTYWEQTVVFCDFFQFYVLWGFYSLLTLNPPPVLFFFFGMLCVLVGNPLLGCGS